MSVSDAYIFEKLPWQSPIAAIPYINIFARKYGLYFARFTLRKTATSSSRNGSKRAMVNMNIGKVVLLKVDK
jgi:hypothetical protein